ncbi:RidA family protein [Halomarina oriensis]|uniref:RidA family protein n=1 Tax=Halomarina oriensis TaxID=671145 RepID=A0A6B0GPH9_9EURY|nr:RidA family protein [Halomarina oriensis]MWG36630.1 RidA family protein [Halomarina oriensis]
MRRQRVQSGTEWEKRVGYSRAVRVGRRVFVAGTTATDDSGAVLDGDAYEQTARVLRNVERALTEAGASLDDVVRTRMFVTDADDWEQVGKAHEEAFGDVRPAATMVEVSRLVDPAMCVEIEVDAVVDGPEDE